MKAFILSILLLLPLVTWGEAPPVLTDENGVPIGRSFGEPASDDTSTDNDGLSDDNLNNDNGSFSNTGSGAEQNAQQSQGDSGLTQALGMMMGAAFMMQCNKPPGNIAPCILGAMSFVDAMASAGNKGNSVNFGNSLLPGGVDDTTGEGSGGGDGGDTDPMVQEAQAQLQALEDLGVISNADGSVTGPDGQNFTGSDFASAAALQNKGIPAGQAAAALDLLQSARDNAEAELGEAGAGRAVASVNSGGGGAGGGSIAPLPDLIIDEDDGAGSGSGSGRRGKVGRMTASEAGKLSKNFNGTPIGIGIADIFQIITQKYDDKEDQQAFINKEY